MHVKQPRKYFLFIVYGNAIKLEIFCDVNKYKTSGAVNIRYKLTMQERKNTRRNNKAHDCFTSELSRKKISWGRNNSLF